MKQFFPTAAIATILALASGVPARATFITDHAYFQVSGTAIGVSDDGIITDGFSDQGTGATYAGGSGSASATGNLGRASGSASARSGGLSGIIPFSLVGSSASARGSTPHIGVYPDASTEGTAAWEDILFIEGLSSRSTVRFVIDVHAVLNTDVPEDLFDTSTARAFLRTLIIATNGFAPSASSDAYATLSGHSILGSDFHPTGDWADLEFLGGELRGTLHLDVEVDPDAGYFGQPGAVWFRLQQTTEAGVRKNASASANGMSTSGLRAVLLSDPDLGFVTPESLGLGVRFDSGMGSPNQVQAVPEPAGLTLLGTAVPVLLGGSVRRWRGRNGAGAWAPGTPG